MKNLKNYQHIAKSFGMAVMTISCKNLGDSLKSQCSFRQPQPVIATSWPESRTSLDMDGTLNNQICFALFLSLTFGTSFIFAKKTPCKMGFWYLSHRDDIFVSKLSLESSIHFYHSGFIFQVFVFVMVKCSNLVFFGANNVYQNFHIKKNYKSNWAISTWKVSKNYFAFDSFAKMKIEPNVTT